LKENSWYKRKNSTKTSSGQPKHGFLLVIDGVRKEKERLTAANLLRVIPGPFLPLPSLFPNLVPFGMVPRRMEERDKELEEMRNEPLVREDMLERESIVSQTD